MPIYDYRCSDCGDFTTLRPMALSSAPADCPQCKAVSPRVLASMPMLATSDSAVRRAHETNERAAHAPASSGSYLGGRHRPGCGCCSGASRSSTTRRAADGSKSFPTRRPWQISH